MTHFDKDRAEVLDRARAAGVARMITVATNLADAKKAAEIVQNREGLFMALGMHPHDAKSADDDVMREMTALARSPKVVAWGEIGLDYHYDNSPRHIQRNAFAEQLYIARELDLPLIIHTRDANTDTLGVLENEVEGDYLGVVHCFGGDIPMARRVLSMGFKLGFTGTITYKQNMMAHQIIRFAGIDNILVETDCPYLTPNPHRGKRNEPSYTVLVAQSLAEILGLPLETVAEKTVGNTLEVFSRMKNRSRI